MILGVETEFSEARLPCNCAPLYKWYLEPLMSQEQKDSMLLGAKPPMLRLVDPKMETLNFKNLFEIAT